jgi:hypothetical protein
MDSIAMLILLPELNISGAVAMNRNETSRKLFDIIFKIAALFLLDRK